jgi:hypothetical protein
VAIALFTTKEEKIVVTKKINDDGSITWTYSSIEELAAEMQKSCENPYRLDDDLEAKDRADERIWGY